MNEPGSLFINLDLLLEILGNPTRRIILSKLAKVPHSASELARALGISRQAVHSQLNILSENEIIENVGPDPRGGKFRIKSNLSVQIHITPDYYNVSYSTSKIDDTIETIQLKDIGYDKDYKTIKNPNKKLRFLGEKIKDIEQGLQNLEKNRSALLQNKECLIVELKNIIKNQFDKELTKEEPREKNLEKEIFYTLFYDPIKYFKKINIDKLLDDMFFSNMAPLRRERHRVSVQHLLKDLSKFMDFFREEENDWFIDF